MKLKKIIVGLLIIIELIMVNLTYQSFLHKEINKEKNAINKKQFAMYVNNGNGYKEYNGESLFPQGYYLNKNMSHCEDINGNEVENVISAEGNKITITSNKTVYCTLYFEVLFKGSGTEEDPYQINVIEDLVRLSNIVNNGETYSGKYFELMRSLDFKSKDSYENSERTDFGDINGINETETLIKELTDPEGSGFFPIGLNVNFEGNIDGKNNRIDNLWIYNTKDINKRYAFIGCLTNGSVSNLTVAGEIKTDVETPLGGLVNRIANSTMDNCVNEINITSKMGRYAVGGLVGWSSGKTSTIKNSNNKGNITNGGYSGGIIGGNQGETLTIENCHNYGKIENNLGYSTGGLIGESVSNNANKTIIKNSSNNGEILINNQNDTTQYVGGLIGRTSKELEITNSYNKGPITHNRIAFNNFVQINIGGIVGLINNNTDNLIITKINNSYNEGNITGGTYVGGIIGYNLNNVKTIINGSYNSGILDNSNLSFTATSRASTVTGGVLGFNNGNNSKNYIANEIIINSYNKGNIIGFETTSGIVGTSLNTVLDVIINSYNIGAVSNQKTNNVSGIGYFNIHNSSLFNKLIINNIYNFGLISSSGTNVYGLGNISNSVDYTISNAYYNNINSRGTNLTDNNIRGMSENEIKNQTFVDTLNNNLATIDLKSIDPLLSDYILNKWKLGSEGYPVLDGEYITDLSGSGHNGISYAVSHNEEGVTTSTDENNIGYVNCGFINYDFGDSISVVVRFKVNTLNKFQRLINNMESAGIGIDYGANNKIKFHIFDNELDPPAYTNPGESDTTFNSLAWYTVVGTYDGKNLSMYINGSLDKESTVSGKIKPSPMPLLLGANPNKSNNPSIPNIEEPAYVTFSDALIFDRALSEDEIKTNYSDIPNPVNKDELLLWYKF